MLIVDAQVHIWSAGPPTNQAHRQVTSYSAEECIRDMDAAGVNACLLHPPGWDPNSGKISEEAAAKYPNRFGILGNFPLDRPENRSLIDTWKSRPGMLGLRYAFTQPHQANWMTDGTMDWLWPAAEKAGIPIALMASNYLPQVDQIAEPRPNPVPSRRAVALVDRLLGHKEGCSERKAAILSRLHDQHLDQHLKRANIELVDSVLDDIEVTSGCSDKQRIRELVRNDRHGTSERRLSRRSRTCGGLATCRRHHVAA